MFLMTVCDRDFLSSLQIFAFSIRIALSALWPMVVSGTSPPLAVSWPLLLLSLTILLLVLPWMVVVIMTLVINVGFTVVFGDVTWKRVKNVA